jgi:hypothetical protein
MYGPVFIFPTSKGLNDSPIPDPEHDHISENGNSLENVHRLIIRPSKAIVGKVRISKRTHYQAVVVTEFEFLEDEILAEFFGRWLVIETADFPRKENANLASVHNHNSQRGKHR